MTALDEYQRGRDVDYVSDEVRDICRVIDFYVEAIQTELMNIRAKLRGDEG
jgi:hypothetical protein